MKKNTLERRVQTGEYVGDSIYASGLFRICQYLFLDLSDLLETEGRRFGVMISYLDSVYQICKLVNIENDDDTSQKIIYLYKPLVISEFKRLCRKHISRADAVIILLKRILEIITEIDSFQFSREAKSLLKIVDKLFDNIRNKAKNTSLEKMTTWMTDFLDQGLVGRYGLDKMSILDEEEKRARTTLIGSGVRIKEEHSKILEVTWKDE